MSKIDELAKEFLSKKNIAVAGVRRSNDSVANIIFKKLKETGHNVFPINPNMDTFEGIKCHPDVRSVTEKIDGIVIATRSSITEQIIIDCVEAGVQRVWMHNMLGNKGSNKPTTSISEKAVQICRENNIAVISGGCPMMFCEPVDFGHKCLRGIIRLTGGFRF